MKSIFFYAYKLNNLHYNSLFNFNVANEVNLFIMYTDALLLIILLQKAFSLSMWASQLKDLYKNLFYRSQHPSSNE